MLVMADAAFKGSASGLGCGIVGFSLEKPSILKPKNPSRSILATRSLVQLSSCPWESDFKPEHSKLKLKALPLPRKPWPLRSIVTLTAGQHVS